MYFQRAESLETSLQTLSQQVEDLSASVTQVRQTTMVYAITVSYTPFQEESTIPGDIVTYLSGVAEVTGISRIPYRPLLVTISFYVEVNEDSEGTVDINYTPQQAVTITTPGIDLIQVPWGAFPVTIQGFKPGEQIQFMVYVTATATWTPMDAKVAEQTIIHAQTMEVS